MAQLAIKGHPTRGKEVIEILEILGGSNFHNYGADCDSLCFYLGKSTNIIYYDWVNNCYEDEDILVYTLEEFEEKFPYKVEDKVIYEDKIRKINKMVWVEQANTVVYKVDDKLYCTTIDDLQPYKEEETMEEPKELIIGFTKDDNGDWILNTHKDYEIKEIEGKYKVIRKKPQYPKTYEECCEVLGISDNRGFGFINLSECENTLMSHFIQLKRCRDAYWKIAGELGLGKPWKPDFTNTDDCYFAIKTCKGKISLISTLYIEDCILAFPTEEMRDAFYENFKDLIEECKELL